MKTPSRTLFLILTIIVTLAVVSCATYQFVANQQALLVIGTHTASQTTYVKWKSKTKFDDALNQVCANKKGVYDITVLMDDRATPIPHYRPCPSPGNIRLVKVTKSKVAGSAAAGDPHVTMSVASSDPADVAVVAAALKK